MAQERSLIFPGASRDEEKNLFNIDTSSHTSVYKCVVNIIKEIGESVIFRLPVAVFGHLVEGKDKRRRSPSEANIHINKV
jgi:hypothetical protein